MIWDHHDPFYLFAGTDGGSLCCVDVRCSAAVFTKESAHSSALSSLALSPSLTGCLVSASTDRSVKLWDVRDHSCPQLVRRRPCKVGEIHCAAACPDEALVFCVGGEFEMKLINFGSDETVTKKFAVSSPDLTGKTVTNTSPSDSTTNNLASDNHGTGKVSRKSKITDPVPSSGSPDTANKSCKSDRTDRKESKKSKKSKVEPQSTGGEVKTSAEESRVKNKHKKDAKAKTKSNLCT